MDKAVQIIIDYVEGVMPIWEFQAAFKNNLGLVKILKNKINKPYLQDYGYNIYDYLNADLKFTKGNWDNVYVRYAVWFDLCEWLKYHNIAFVSFLKYKEDYNFILDIQPSWVDIIDDQGIFDKIIAEVPKDLSKTKRILWGKNKIKEVFKYDKTYPRWIQDPEWPIINGTPLIFSHQKRAGKDNERTFYYFYDPDTREETVITQFY